MFYVGYQPQAPKQLAQFLKRTIAALLLLAASTATILLLAQSPFIASKFEFGEFHEHEGDLITTPYPALLTPQGTFLLVSPGKHGFHQTSGNHVKLQGALIQNGQNRMLEVLPGSLINIHPTTTQSETNLGTATFTGEIVDTKCYFGVMNPGRGKVHRDCAARCISGGLPAGLLVQNPDGTSQTILLAGANGRPLSKEVLDFVAEPIKITGQLVRTGQLLTLKAEPKTYQRE